MLGQDRVTAPGRDFTVGRNLCNWPASDPRLSKRKLFWGRGSVTLTKLPCGSHFHLPSPAQAKVWRGSSRFHWRRLEPRESSAL